MPTDTQLDKDLAKIEAAIRFFDKTHLTTDDFLKSFELLVQIVQDIRQGNDAEFELIHDTLKKLEDELKQSAVDSFEVAKKEAKDAISSLLDTLRAEHHAKLREVDDKLAVVQNGKDADEEMITADVLSKIPPPDTADDIRNKLELLPDGEKLKIEAIENLREELDELKKRRGSTTVIGGGSSGGGIVKAYDLSASLDGVTKTFALPAFWRVISVNLTSFPSVLRPTVDYTTDASAMTITFTSEIDAATALATGQTCLIIYAES